MFISEFLFRSNNTVNPNLAHQVTLMHLDLRLPFMRLHSLYQGRPSSQYHLLPKHQRKHMKLLKDHVRCELAIIQLVFKSFKSWLMLNHQVYITFDL